MFAKSLARKTVLLSDGTVLGVLHNINVDFRTGSLISLVVKPQNEVSGIEKVDGYYIIPFESVKSISDYIVVDRKRLSR